MKNIVINIEGMKCEGCSTRLEKVLNSIDGVNSANVSLEKKEACIEYREDEVTLEEIKETIIDAGFEVI